MTRDSLYVEDASFPKYSIRAAARMVGVSPVTLRAWERRYCLRPPVRTQGGYRLYSERDVAALRWLRAQAEAGIPLARAALSITAWSPPQGDTTPQLGSMPAKGDSNRAIEAFVELCLKRLLAFDDKGAEEILNLAAQSHAFDEIAGALIPAVVREVGELWQRQQTTVAGEHFVSQCLTHYLMLALREIPGRDRAPRVLAACAPGEQHQIGLLVIAVLLARRGVEVVYLGADLPIDRIAHTLGRLQPRLVLFSATRRESARALIPLQAVLDEAAQPPPPVVLGGPPLSRRPRRNFPSQPS